MNRLGHIDTPMEQDRAITIHSLPTEVLIYILSHPLIYVNRLSVNYTLRGCIIYVCERWYACIRANVHTYITMMEGVSGVATYYHHLPAMCFSGLTMMQKIALANEPEILSNDGKLLARLNPQYRVAWPTVFEYAFAASKGLPRYEDIPGSNRSDSSVITYHCNTMYTYEQYRRYIYERIPADTSRRLKDVYVPTYGIYGYDYIGLYAGLWMHMSDDRNGSYYDIIQQARREFGLLLAAIEDE